MNANPYQAPAAELKLHAPEHGAAPELWNPDAAGNWSLFFTPVFGSILIGKNWDALGHADKASRARIWAYVTLPFALFGLGMPLLIIWYFSSNRPQARYIKERWGTSYPRKPWGKPLGIAFGVYFGIFVLFMGASLLSTAEH